MMRNHDEDPLVDKERGDNNYGMTCFILPNLYINIMYINGLF